MPNITDHEEKSYNLAKSAGNNNLIYFNREKHTCENISTLDAYCAPNTYRKNTL